MGKRLTGIKSKNPKIMAIRDNIEFHVKEVLKFRGIYLMDASIGTLLKVAYELGYDEGFKEVKKQGWMRISELNEKGEQ
jgi:hypothetical protein